MRDWHPISKLAVALGVIGLIAFWWSDTRPPSETGIVGARAATTPSSLVDPGGVRRPTEADLVPRVLPPLQAFEIMVDRPLFSSSRRPAEPLVDMAALPMVDWDAPMPEPEAGPVLPDVRFIGSIEKNGQVRALVGEGLSVRGLALGEEVDGWTVLEIGSRNLVLGFDNERLELKILE